MIRTGIYETAAAAGCKKESGVLPTVSRISFLHVVTGHELSELQKALVKGVLPADFEAKLCRLAGPGLLQRFVEKTSRLFAALLISTYQGTFKEARATDCERLLRVLAYVRKEDDAIPDYKPDGFEDDLFEVRAAMTELEPLLQAFKTWHLRHQVPGMWLN